MEENKIKFTEKISLKLREKLVLDRTKTILIILVLFAAYVALNLWASQADLPEIDVTKNKIYTLSETSKKALTDINQEVHIYAYGFEEKGSLTDLLKQYNKCNDKITYELLTSESNYNMIQEYGLQEGYYMLIFKSGESEKIVDASSEFSTYDYTTYQSVDTTEQTITNSILGLVETNKPKVYSVQGHEEYGDDALNVLKYNLLNEGFTYETINLATVASIPEDCNILAIFSPTTDIYESEAQLIKDYIAKGGNIYLSMDVVNKSTTMPNLQSILDEFGATVQNGYVLEYADGQAMANYPYIFMPQVSATNKITADIYTDSYMWLVYSARLNYKSDEELAALNVTKETLLSSTEDSLFITDIEASLQDAAQTATAGTSEIASLLTKNITTTNEAGEQVTNTAKLILSASGNFGSDYIVKELSQTYPLSYIGSNKDFVINSLAYLGDKGNSLTIRKDFSSATYMPTNKQNIIVLSVIFGVPVVIALAGIGVWVYRKRR